jgi:hypothetical protein
MSANFKQTMVRLRKLRAIQLKLGRQLERAYVRNNVTDYLAMEMRQQRISLLIDKLWGQLDEKGRRTLKQTQPTAF